MSAKMPIVLVCAGGGGVGKTTSAAALALALARTGWRTLVVTIDPARRLADAMGVELGNGVQIVRIDPRTDDRLLALMPEPAGATRIFMEYLFEEEPEALARLLSNQLFLTLEDKLVGMSELVAMSLVLRAIETSNLDVVVVDTAPSRYALDFLTYPTRLSSLLEGRAVKWLGNLASRAEGEDTRASRFSSWGRRRVEAAIGAVLGVSLVRDTTHLFAEISLVRKRFADIAAQLGKLLLGKGARYLLVAAPTGAAQADVEFLLERIESLHKPPLAVLLNRSDLKSQEWSRVLRNAPESTPAILDALMHLEAERESRLAAASAFATHLAVDHVGLLRIPLPLVEAVEPVDIVSALADELEPFLTQLTGLKPNH
ncbi:MAG: hypothetical protein AUK47_05710 [Deltaproteobacteria bacterium CG2_30_63_29]|nr:MAG: hypothetical protein AUK47_05710 [Deltaproteobacteria bacterium CG2_30_63_29]PJB42165.1 MAG: hypothetical protein CO108_12095 [Deltaproteobacteria bacterium CG_4_9_14_3_um_filter_63_12]